MLTTLLVASCAKEDDVRVYEVIVPPGAGAAAKPAGPMAASPAMGAAAASQAASVKWQAPGDWQPQALTDMINRGHYLLPGTTGGQAVLTISAYAGEAGGLAANVNRWRRQLGLAEDPAAAGAMVPVVVGGHSIATCYFDGQKPDGSAAAMAGGVLSLPGETWFFKMNGSKDAVAAARPAFDAFLKSLQIGAAEAPASPAPAAGAGKPAGPKPVFTAPATWKEMPAESMRALGFRINGPDGMDAEVSVVKLAGGTDLQNVNMWNQQLKLPETTEAGLDKVAPVESLGANKARVFDGSTVDKVINNTFRGRILAAIIHHNDSVWIVRLKGEHNHVEMEMANFRSFISSLQLP